MSKRKVYIDRLIQALLVCSLIPWLIGITLMIMLLPPVTQFWSGLLSDFHNAAVSKEELLDAADAGLRYVNGGMDNMPRGLDERFAFTDDVLSHMQDVRKVFSLARMVTIILSIIIVGLGILSVARKEIPRLGRSMALAAILTFLLIAAFVFIGWLNFDFLFTKMHELLFAEGSWLFRYDSLLINAYPLAFWIAMAATWAVLIMVFCFLFFAVGRRLGSKKQR